MRDFCSLRRLYLTDFSSPINFSSDFTPSSDNSSQRPRFREGNVSTP
jgi:hypothetical protein